jgi:hypothetical protein
MPPREHKKRKIQYKFASGGSSSIGPAIKCLFYLLNSNSSAQLLFSLTDGRKIFGFARNCSDFVLG